jgi:hypothetical protein
MADDVVSTLGKFEKFVDGVGRVADNVWAFLLFGLASALAALAHAAHDKDLLQFASTVAMTGAALFHGKDHKAS